jgi:hypothetical protein
MALTRLPSFTLLNTDSFTFANLTLTGNITANNGNLGNAATANFFIGNGSSLTSITGANVTGFVPNANVANTAYSVAGGNVTGAVAYATTANSVAGANVSGFVANANVANTAYSIAGGNVSGQVSNALVAGTVYTNAQPNITSVGTLTSLSVTNDVTVGGNLIVNGTTTTVNSTTVNINDVNIVLANNATSAAQANGAGITINGAAATLNYVSSTNAFTFSHKISADGSLLSNLSGANITGFVPNADVANTAYSVAGGNVTGQVGNSLLAGTVYTNAQPNITSVGTLSSLSVTGNITAGNVDGGNLVNANYVSGNGSLLTSLTGANVTGFVPNANVANTAYSVAVSNVTGIGNIATINLDGNSSNILYGNGSFASAPVTFGNSNVAAYLPTYTGNLSPGNLTVSTKANLGSVANITITGGNANYVLKTDGAGNLSWTEMTGGSGGGGNLDGLTDVTVTSPSNGDVLKFDTDSSLWINTPITNNVNKPYVTRIYTGDGSNVSYTVSSGTSTDSVIVTLSGIVQTPTSDYSISGTTLTFTSAPPNGVAIQIREIGVPLASGTNAQILFNDAGSMAGAAGLTFNKSTNTLYSTNLATSSANLGLVNNIRITGGSAGQVLTTNGNGTVSWATAVIGSTGNSTVLPDSIVDYFTGDGSNSTFTLSAIPTSTSYVLVNINGVFQFRDSFTLANNEITFGSVPLNNSRIEVTTLQTGAVQVSTFSSSMVPTLDITYDLGNSTHRWRDLYLSGNTMYIGEASISVSSTTGEIALTPAPTASNPTPVSRPILPDTTNNNGKFLTTDGANVSWATVDAFPTQTSNTGKYLTTNGTSVSWATVDAFPTQTSNTGKYLTTNGTSVSWVDVYPTQTSNTGKFLSTDGTSVSWASVDALPSQTGNSGKFLTTNGTTASWAVFGSLDTPTVTGPTQANESSTQSFTITNYNASYAYIIAVTGGSVSRSGSTISWTMPSVNANTSFYMTTMVSSNGVTSYADTRTVLVIDLQVDDAAVVVSDFSYNNINSGWVV